MIKNIIPYQFSIPLYGSGTYFGVKCKILQSMVLESKASVFSLAFASEKQNVTNMNEISYNCDRITPYVS